MKCQRLIPLVVFITAGGACHAQTTMPSAIVASDESRQAAAYRFSADDEKLLDQIQRGCFNYFWKEVGSPALLVKDRLKAPVSSIAAVGFQLSSLAIGVERGWCSRDEAQQRAQTILRSLLERDDNKYLGMYAHFPDHNTAGVNQAGFDPEISTVDTALLVAGVITASEYFGGAVRELGDRMVADINWRAFALPPDGLISMAWKPTDGKKPAAGGRMLDHKWWINSDEERLVYLFAVGAPRAEFALEPAVYYKLKREVRRYGGLPPFVVSWPGPLFTYFFSHCWIDYQALGPDDPARFGSNAPAVDWFENSRRAVLTHKRRCNENADCLRQLGENGWGLSACVGRDGYIVPQLQPNLSNEDNFHDCTITPYAAGSAIMFTREESMAALRAFYELKSADGRRLVWSDPESGGYGLADSFSIKQGYVCDDYVGIDEGPLLLAIENARTKLIWKTFMKSPHVRRGLKRLGLDKTPG
ncbi:hypothetical protein RAS1_33890 [Phycisphaerae bacterium RAS1]|nr:hypothetical protein RAS1_33890 [Phycisphaerae bacterium RAS1]